MLNITNIAKSILEGHRRFLLNNTGDTIDPTLDNFVLNNQGVIANNRHFINKTRMQYQPNGDGTSEGQTLHILGHCYAYLATKDNRYLVTAKQCWQAYVDYFYDGQPIPETPQRWIANWIVNAKEPVLANYPINPTEPTKGGFKGTPVNFVNGIALIPHGAPTWGEYLDVATFAYEGVLGWDSIVASVYADDGTGSPNWSVSGIKYPVDWIIAWSGEKVDSNGNILSTNHPSQEHGTVKLKDITVTGTYKFNYATRQPVEHGGYLIGRNEVQHNRPLHTPLLGSVYQMGNAADAEEWFADACYLLYKITNEAKYKKALDCCLFTLNEFVRWEQFSGLTKYFKRSTFLGQTDIFTSGTSYGYSYPGDTIVTYSRDANGYIVVNTDKSSKHYLEHKGITKTISETSAISVELGGQGITNMPLSFSIKLECNNVDSDDAIDIYNSSIIQLQPNVDTYLIPISSFVKEETVTDTVLASLDIVSGWGGMVLTESYTANILGSYSGSAVTCFAPDDNAGAAIGFWNTTSGRSPLNSIVYKSDGDFDIRIVDDNGWRWYWLLPNTLGEWVTFTFNKEDLYLSGYQPNHLGEPDPIEPVYSTVDEVTLLLENSSDTNLSFTFYCINNPATTFDITNKYLRNFRITLNCDEAFQAKVGNCFMTDPADFVDLRYTPGLMPFSNLYEENGKIDSTNGLPYPGYQYPFIFALEYNYKATELNNMVDFLYDSQVWYNQQFGVLGPVASAYILDIPSNTSYGPANTFTMYHWGSDKAWSGYQPRAFQAGARTLQELKDRNITPPTKLVTYVNNWINWLTQFVQTHGILPTDYPSDGPPLPITNDFTGHMSGLYLAGACMAYLAGIENSNITKLMDACFKELAENYVVGTGEITPMNGGWSPSPSTGMYFGFWSGEIMRGISLYILCQEKAQGSNILN